MAADVSGYRMEISPPTPPRGTTRALHYFADIYSEGPRVWRWRTYVQEDNGQTVIESNGGQPDEQAARDVARTWLIEQSRLLHGADH